MSDRGHNEFCPTITLNESGSCHCDQHLDPDTLNSGLSCAGWKHKGILAERKDYFWREISDCEAIQLNRLDAGWEYRWIKGQETWIMGVEYATPKEAIAGLYAEMHIMMKQATKYREKIYNFRSALDGLKL